MPSGRRGAARHSATVLEAARQLGIDLESICGGRQTCGKCLVTPEYGAFPKHNIISDADHLSPPTANELAYARKHGLDLSQQRLGCAACIQGDVLIHVPDSSLARKQVIRKAAGDRTIDVKPAVRLVYVEVLPPTLGSRGDWQRLQDALAEQWDLHNLRIDPVLLRTIQGALRAADGAVTVTLWEGCEVIRIEPGYVESLYGVAVDIGSTTLAAHLCDLRTGTVLATETMMNPQVRYGEDLISRISYAADPAGMKRLHHAIIQALNELCQIAAQTARIDVHNISDLVLVGNTVMHHLLLGINPVEIGQMPFTLATDEALDLRARDLGLKVVHDSARVHVLPCLAGYVGADNVAVLLAEYPYLNHKAVSLIVDIGTNAEILLCAGERILSASSPTGPAFEGAQISNGQRAAVGAIERVRITEHAVRYKVIGDERWSDALPDGKTLRPTGICGSGIIEAVAGMFAAGWIDASGRLKPSDGPPVEGVRPNGWMREFVLAPATETASGQAIVITQKDIRAIQLAKAALYAGAKLLMDRLGVRAVDHIRLAGAFGSYIDPLYAMRIGLIPDCDLAQVISAGNAAGDGARIALLNIDQRAHITELVKRVEYVETAAEPQFQDYFVEAMHLPHTVDRFPHLESVP